MNKLLNLGIFTVFTIAALFFFSPLLRNFTGLLPDDSDGVVITWHLNKFVQNPTFIPEKLFQGNILYPNPYVQAYTDPYITDSLIAYSFVKLTGEPVVAFNVNLMISQVLLLFFTFLFLKQLTKNFWISAVFSLALGFSPIRLHYLGHLQMFSLYWVPLAGYFLLKLTESKKVVFIYLFFAALLLQTLNSFLPGYFILFMALGMTVGIGDLRQVLVKNFKHTIIAGLLALAILLPYIRIYFLVSSIFDHTRPIRDSINFSLSPEEVFTKFFSLLLLLLFFISVVHFFFNQRKGKSAISYLLLAVSSYILSLGPALHYFGKTIKVLVPLIKVWLPIPLPYMVAYYLLPGFNGFRTPSRWIFMFGFFIVVFSAVVLTKFFEKLSGKVKFLSLMGVFLLVVFTTKTPNFYQIPKVAEYPKVYSWLRAQPGKIAIEMPIYFWRNQNLVKIESYRMLFGLYHSKLMINGTTGFTPAPFEQNVEFLQKNFPGPESITMIKSLKVDYLIIHEKELKDFWKDSYGIKIKILNNNDKLKEIYSENGDIVYEIM